MDATQRRLRVHTSRVLVPRDSTARRYVNWRMLRDHGARSGSSQVTTRPLVTPATSNLVGPFKYIAKSVG